MIDNFPRAIDNISWLAEWKGSITFSLDTITTHRSRWSCSSIPFSRSPTCNAFLFVDIDQSTMNLIVACEDPASFSWRIDYFNNIP